eukprot:CFRG4345T1
MTSSTIAYRLLTADEWAQTQKCGQYMGTAVDIKSNFIHMSTAAQAKSTAELYFANVNDLMIATIDLTVLGDCIQWDMAPSRGEVFPHYYPPSGKDLALPLNCIAQVEKINIQHINRRRSLLTCLVTQLSDRTLSGSKHKSHTRRPTSDSHLSTYCEMASWSRPELFAIMLASMLSGAAIVHNIMKPDLLLPAVEAEKVTPAEKKEPSQELSVKDGWITK